MLKNPWKMRQESSASNPPGNFPDENQNGADSSRPLPFSTPKERDSASSREQDSFIYLLDDQSPSRISKIRKAKSPDNAPGSASAPGATKVPLKNRKSKTANLLTGDPVPELVLAHGSSTSLLSDKWLSSWKTFKQVIMVPMFSIGLLMTELLGFLKVPDQDHSTINAWLWIIDTLLTYILHKIAGLDSLWDQVLLASLHFGYGMIFALVRHALVDASLLFLGGLFGTYKVFVLLQALYLITDARSPLARAVRASIWATTCGLAIFMTWQPFSLFFSSSDEFMPGDLDSTETCSGHFSIDEIQFMNSGITLVGLTNSFPSSDAERIVAILPMFLGVLLFSLVLPSDLESRCLKTEIFIGSLKKQNEGEDLPPLVEKQLRLQLAPSPSAYEPVMQPILDFGVIQAERLAQYLELEPYSPSGMEIAPTGEQAYIVAYGTVLVREGSSKWKMSLQNSVFVPGSRKIMMQWFGFNEMFAGKDLEYSFKIVSETFLRSPQLFFIRKMKWTRFFNACLTEETLVQLMQFTASLFWSTTGLEREFFGQVQVKKITDEQHPIKVNFSWNKEQWTEDPTPNIERFFAMFRPFSNTLKCKKEAEEISRKLKEISERCKMQKVARKKAERLLRSKENELARNNRTIDAEIASLERKLREEERRSMEKVSLNLEFNPYERTDNLDQPVVGAPIRNDQLSDLQEEIVKGELSGRKINSNRSSPRRPLLTQR